MILTYQIYVVLLKSHQAYDSEFVYKYARGKYLGGTFSIIFPDCLYKRPWHEIEYTLASFMFFYVKEISPIVSVMFAVE